MTSAPTINKMAYVEVVILVNKLKRKFSRRLSKKSSIQLIPESR